MESTPLLTRQSGAAAECLFGELRGQRVSQTRVMEGGSLRDVPGPLEVEATFVVP